MKIRKNVVFLTVSAILALLVSSLTMQARYYYLEVKNESNGVWIEVRDDNLEQKIEIPAGYHPSQGSYSTTQGFDSLTLEIRKDNKNGKSLFNKVIKVPSENGSQDITLKNNEKLNLQFKIESEAEIYVGGSTFPAPLLGKGRVTLTIKEAAKSS
jgi:hypothetical protein